MRRFVPIVFAHNLSSYPITIICLIYTPDNRKYSLRNTPSFIPKLSNSASDKLRLIEYLANVHVSFFYYRKRTFEKGGNFGRTFRHFDI